MEPLRTPPDAQARLTPIPAATRPSVSSSLKVLVAEDEEGARAALVAAIRSLGHSCRGARDGLEAWQMHLRDRADVIVSDWQMPRMDGLELCRRTRVSGDEGTYTYFILMTSYDDKEHFISGMEAGADDYHKKPVDLDELRARLVSAARVLSVYRELAEKNARLRRDSQAQFRVARVDALTQVANRLSMEEDLKALWARVERYGHRYSIAICDVDKFKDYNDRYGHLAGDDVLRQVAQAIRQELRAGDGIYRYGGEEFVVVLPEQSQKEAFVVLDRIRASIEKLGIVSSIPADPQGGKPAPPRFLTISAGVAELDPAIDSSSQDWLRRADSALYRAKEAGRNRVEVDPREAVS
jgi:two-component system, cell cycle response regulator